MRHLPPQLLRQFAAGEPMVPPAEPDIEERFLAGDEAARWYNGWLITIPPPSPPLHEVFGWDPVCKWYDFDGRPLFWYVVGTGKQPTLVVETDATMRGWGNQYFTFYSWLHGRDVAESMLEAGSVPEGRPPEVDLSTSPPETQFILKTRGLRPY